VRDKPSMKKNDNEEEDVFGSQNKTKPFDICTPKQGPILKPSLYIQNKEKRKEKNQGRKGVELRPGMFHLKGYISLTYQVKIVKVCRESGLGDGGFYQPCYEDGTMLHLKRMCLGRNWDHQTSQYGYQRQSDGSHQIPAIKDSHSLTKPSYCIPVPSISPDICIVNFYAKNGRLGLHQASVFLHPHGVVK